MNSGLFFYCQGRGIPHDQAYQELLEQIELGEQLGFTEAWFVEHHFTDYSLLPSPNLIIASAVQRTTRMRFGNYINVLPIHHPLRLAAEAAMLDNLARGRFDFGIGKGVRPGEFAKFEVDFADAPAMTDEAIEIIVKAWTEERFSYEGKFWRIEDAMLRPRPFQKPHPPIHMVATHKPTVEKVGANGWPVALHFTPIQELPAAIEAYRAAVPAGVPSDGPFRPRFVVCRELCVAESEAEARDKARLAVQGFWHLSNLLPPPPPPDFSDERLKQLTTRVLGGKTFDEIEQAGIVLAGTPDQVAEKVRRLEAIGVDTLLVLASYGTLTHEQTCRSMELFAEAVMRSAAAV
jgi:alkanesulfonate monooxygenase SsuD/methylene tetrahydromethanopterin reductase-like flavin-dependent oxidoreductase (luciferase family)